MKDQRNHWAQNETQDTRRVPKTARDRQLVDASATALVEENDATVDLN
jgi:hypothetical protein